MKVIFLDHDGVICLSNNWGTRFTKQKKWGGRKMSMRNDEIPLDYRFDDFDKKAIKLLNSILEETGAEIVVSSDWKRWASVEQMGTYYEQQGIIKKPIAFTKNLGECDWHIKEKYEFPWSRNFDLEQCRIIEIKQYLVDHPEITHWVSIDDLKMGKTGTYQGMEFEHEYGLENFVETPKGSEGIKQTGIKEKIINFLL
jgi:hypothetical protein